MLYVLLRVVLNRCCKQREHQVRSIFSHFIHLPANAAAKARATFNNKSTRTKVSALKSILVFLSLFLIMLVILTTN